MSTDLSPGFRRRIEIVGAIVDFVKLGWGILGANMRVDSSNHSVTSIDKNVQTPATKLAALEKHLSGFMCLDDATDSSFLEAAVCCLRAAADLHLRLSPTGCEWAAADIKSFADCLRALQNNLESGLIPALR